MDGSGFESRDFLPSLGFARKLQWQKHLVNIKNWVRLFKLNVSWSKPFWPKKKKKTTTKVMLLFLLFLFLGEVIGGWKCIINIIKIKCLIISKNTYPTIKIWKLWQGGLSQVPTNPSYRYSKHILILHTIQTTFATYRSPIFHLNHL